MNRALLEHELKKVSVAFADKWSFLLRCEKCGGSWHPFTFPAETQLDQEGGVYLDLDSLPDGKEIYTAFDAAALTDAMQGIFCGLSLGYWKCPGGCNARLNVPPEIEFLQLHSIEVDDVVGWVLSSGEVEDFKRHVDSLE